MSVWGELVDQLFPDPGAGGTQWGPPRRVRPACLDPGLRAYALGDYDGDRRAALIAFKERGARRLAGPLGVVLADGVRGLAVDPWLVPVPSGPAAAGRRGGQHVEWLARAAARELARRGCTAGVAPALRMRRTVQDSVGLDRRARGANLRGRVVVRRAGLPPPGAAVVLVDDVITTGSTASACAQVLTRSGVSVCAFVALAAADRDAASTFP